MKKTILNYRFRKGLVLTISLLLTCLSAVNAVTIQEVGPIQVARRQITLGVSGGEFVSEELVCCQLAERNIHSLAGIDRIPTNVQVLDLSNNELDEIPANAFASLPNLQVILLSRNNIAHVDPLAFMNCFALRHLDLSHNEIAVIAQQTLVLCAHLKSINLSHNHLSEAHHDFSVNCFGNNINLREIDLSYNRFDDIPGDLFRHNMYLEVVRLNNNELTALPDNLFTRNRKLAHLDLSTNNLGELPASLLRYIYNGINEIRDTFFVMDLRGNANLDLTNLAHDTAERDVVQLPEQEIYVAHPTNRIDVVRAYQEGATQIVQAALSDYLARKKIYLAENEITLTKKQNRAERKLASFVEQLQKKKSEGTSTLKYVVVGGAVVCLCVGGCVVVAGGLKAASAIAAANAAAGSSAAAPGLVTGMGAFVGGTGAASSVTVGTIAAGSVAAKAAAVAGTAGALTLAGTGIYELAKNESERRKLTKLGENVAARAQAVINWRYRRRAARRFVSILSLLKHYVDSLYLVLYAHQNALHRELNILNIEQAGSQVQACLESTSVANNAGVPLDTFMVSAAQFKDLVFSLLPSDRPAQTFNQRARQLCGITDAANIDEIDDARVPDDTPISDFFAPEEQKILAGSSYRITALLEGLETINTAVSNLTAEVGDRAYDTTTVINEINKIYADIRNGLSTISTFFLGDLLDDYFQTIHRDGDSNDFEITFCGLVQRIEAINRFLAYYNFRAVIQDLNNTVVFEPPASPSTCAICLDDINLHDANSYVTAAPCGHQRHTACDIDAWQEAECPICHANLDPINPWIQTYFV